MRLFLLPVLTGLLLLAGCGQKGPLYIPQESATKPSVSAINESSASQQP